MNIFFQWLTEHWSVIVDIFMWGFSIAMILLLILKIYKVFKIRFEFIDIYGLAISILWIFLVIIFGFENIKSFLLGIL